LQEYPELHDGHMIAEPALNIAKFVSTPLTAGRERNKSETRQQNSQPR
jgi:hypothetical protein